MFLRGQAYWVLAISIALAAGVALVIPSVRDKVFGTNPIDSTPSTPIRTSREAKGDGSVSERQFEEPKYEYSIGLHQYLLATSHLERNHLFSMILADAGAECLSVTGSQYIAVDIMTWQVLCADGHSFAVAISEHGTTKVSPIPTGDFNQPSIETVEPNEP